MMMGIKTFNSGGRKHIGRKYIGEAFVPPAPPFSKLCICTVY